MVDAGTFLSFLLEHIRPLSEWSVDGLGVAQKGKEP